VFEVINDGEQLIGDAPVSEKSSGVPELDLVNKLGEGKEAKDKANPMLLKGGKPPTPKEKQEYAQPYEPAVKKITSYEDYEPDGIKEEQYCSEQGRLIGMRLMQELKFKEGTKRRLYDGELDVEDVIENYQENRGKLGSFDVFSDTAPLIHDHTVCVLIDMSGSMSGEDIRIARGAALMLSKALDEMSVRHSLRGFGAHGGKLEIDDVVIKEFDEPLDITKLRSMFCGDVNRDGGSIRNAMKLISGERGKKLIFVISDGRPNHPDGVGDYRAYNEQAYMDMWHLTREAEKEGISIIGVGVRKEAAEFISKTYLKGFYIDKMDELPEKLIKIYLDETKGLRQTWKLSAIE
jgi:nitric oxide reductase activation protein